MPINSLLFRTFLSAGINLKTEKSFHRPINVLFPQNFFVGKNKFAQGEKNFSPSENLSSSAGPGRCKTTTLEIMHYLVDK
jgi:hypothetical protein